jgi:hypothetical protein
MLKPIHRVACTPALIACQHLMQRFATWLCDPATTVAHLTEQGLQPPVLLSAIEADWLWAFLQREEAKQTLLDRAKALAAMPAAQKVALVAWVQAVAALATQFQPAAAAWPVTCPLADKAHWAAFRTLMEAFYDKGFRTGLPYLADGSPVATGGVKYADFVIAFRVAHRLNPNPNAREVCALCGGPLGDTPHVDHWVTKSGFPLLSMCADNLTLICSTCNEAPNKGDKPVYSGGSFTDWFHPYFRPGNEALQLSYVLHERAVRCSSAIAADQPKVANLDALLNLTSRWTREFKAEYAKHQDVLRRRETHRIKVGMASHTQQELHGYVQQWAADLSPGEPHHEVHTVLGQAMSELARTQAWLVELTTAQQQP